MARTGLSKSTFAMGALIALFALFLPMFAGVAAAQDPTISSDPASVPEEGEYTLTISGENFTAGNSLFLIPCVAPDGDASAIQGADDCDISNLTPVTVGDDGTFSQEVTFEIGEDFAVAAGDAGSTEAASIGIPIDAAAGGDDEPEDGDDDPADPADGEDDEELPPTGWMTNLLVAGGIAMLGAGYFATRAERRFN